MKLRILDIAYETMADGPGLRTSIYCAGCAHACPGCHNPQSWDFKGGDEMSVQELLDIIKDDEYGAAVSGALLTVFLLLFGEISPKLLAKESSEKIACYLAYPLYLMTILLKPLCYLITLWKHFLMKVFKLKSDVE